MREIELKSVVDDLQLRRREVERAGGALTFEGELSDLRYDDAAGSLVSRDYVLRLRAASDGTKRSAQLDWKGETRYEAGYKVREEISTAVEDPDVIGAILNALGYVVIREIERHVAQYSLGGATIRFEQYPRMDVLVEIEGSPAAIESAIVATGLPRGGFTAERLPDFVARFEARTGQRGALSQRELDGEYSYRFRDA